MVLNLLFFSFLLYFLPSVTLASSCEDISGHWRNKRGEEMVIEHSQAGILRGKYYSAESDKLREHDIVGKLPYKKPGSSFGFSVTKQSGGSTTVWTGQCQVCNGKETLHTTWFSESTVDSCADIRNSTLIGKDVFERKLTTENDKGISDNILETTAGMSSGHKCDLRGVWYNDFGSEIILNQTESGIITGEFRTAVELERGSSGNSHAVVHGFGAFGNPKSTFSWIVVWGGGTSVAGWVGQCHICEDNIAVLKMNWLLRIKADSCADEWKSTLYGVNSFTRHEQKPGPRKSLGIHTPNKDREEEVMGQKV